MADDELTNPTVDLPDADLPDPDGEGEGEGGEGEGGDDEGGDDEGDGAADVRVERIEQLVDNSLQEPDALQAAVGAASGDLMLMQYRLRQALDDSLQATPDSLTAIAEALPALNTYLKLSQQVGQYVQLSLKIKSAKGRSQR